MEQTNPSSNCGVPIINPRIYFKISIDGEVSNDQLVFELFVKETPIAVNYFINLCRGIGVKGSDGTPLSYRGSELKSIGEGVTGGVSGAKNLDLDREISPFHLQKGSLCVFVTDDRKRISGSRFVIYAAPPQLLPPAVVIGQIVRGMDLLVSLSGEPKKISVSECGMDALYDLIDRQHQRLLEDHRNFAILLEHQNLMDSVQTENHKLKEEYQNLLETLNAKNNVDSEFHTSVFPVCDDGAKKKTNFGLHSSEVSLSDNLGHETTELSVTELGYESWDLSAIDICLGLGSTELSCKDYCLALESRELSFSDYCLGRHRNGFRMKARLAFETTELSFTDIGLEMEELCCSEEFKEYVMTNYRLYGNWLPLSGEGAPMNFGEEHYLGFEGGELDFGEEGAKIDGNFSAGRKQWTAPLKRCASQEVTQFTSSLVATPLPPLVHPFEPNSSSRTSPSGTPSKRPREDHASVSKKLRSGGEEDSCASS